jgi:hypothetical protein
MNVVTLTTIEEQWTVSSGNLRRQVTKRKDLFGQQFNGAHSELTSLQFKKRLPP